MKTAELVHTEKGTEYYREGNLFAPSFDEKLLWFIVGLPSDIEVIDREFQTVIDQFTGFSKREIESRCNENISAGVYSFLPSMGINHSLTLKF